jgi:hypothetical protein
MTRKQFALALVLALTIAPVWSEIEKTAVPTDHGLELLWWPKVAIPDGWKHDREVSTENYVNMMYPKGESFADSPVVMYTRALYHEHGDTEKELAQAIAEDHQGFLGRFPDSKIAEVAPIETGDGTKLRTFSFAPNTKGNWELVAYGREPTFVVMFCISAHSRAALEQHRPEFLAMVRSYTSKDDK